MKLHKILVGHLLLEWSLQETNKTSLNKTDKQLVKVIETTLNYSHLSKEKGQTQRSLADDKSIVIKKQIRVLL